MSRASPARRLRSSLHNEKRWVVSRTVQDDGTYHGATTYLHVEPAWGNFEWVPHAAHATKMPWLQAVLCSKLCPLLAPEPGEPDDENRYFYHWQQQP